MTKKDKTCFVMMPISTPEGYEEGHFTKVYQQIIKPAVEKAGFTSIRVDEDRLSTNIVEKIFNGLMKCDMAICDLSSRNPNVLYELGIRQAYNKPVILISDNKTERIFDVSGISTVYYNSTRLYEDVVQAVDEISVVLEENYRNPNKVVDIISLSTVKETQPTKLTESKKQEIRYVTLHNDVLEIKKQVEQLQKLTLQNMQNTNHLVKDELDRFYEINKELMHIDFILSGTEDSDVDYGKYKQRLHTLKKTLEGIPPSRISLELFNEIEMLFLKIKQLEGNRAETITID